MTEDHREENTDGQGTPSTDPTDETNESDNEQPVNPNESEEPTNNDTTGQEGE